MVDSAAHSAATRPYDWDDYATDFRSNENYVEQERLILAALIEYPFSNRPEGPASIFEAGPGLGRITRIAHEVYPNAGYSALDISAKALRIAETNVRSEADPSFWFDHVMVGPLQLVQPEAQPSTYDLVIAVEVLMHIPPEEVSQAFDNLLAVAAPGALLITCDWTEPLPNPEAPIRVQNYRHDYPRLIKPHLKPATTWELRSYRIGYQTLYIIELPQ